MMRKGIFRKLFLIIILMPIVWLRGTDIDVKTNFDPKAIPADRVGIFQVTISGGQSSSPPFLPEVEGLSFGSPASYQNIHVLNGQTSITETHNYPVRASEPGQYTIPSFDVAVNGKMISTLPTTVTVLSPSETDSKDIIKLKLSIEEEKVYIGQMVPVTITLLAHQNLRGSLLSNPIQEGQSFTDYGFLNDSNVKIVNIDGKNLQVIEWKTYITPLRSGLQELEYKIIMAIETSRPPETTTRDILHKGFGAFMQNIFAQKEQIELYTIPEKIQVLPLPTNGKPDHFTGAIGQFILGQPSIEASEAPVGEPIVLKFNLKGIGNLNQTNPPKIEVSEKWKSYTPKSNFQPEEAYGYAGTQTFEYILIPQSKEITQTPEITFSTFNPELGQYQEHSIAPLPIAIKPSLVNWQTPTALDNTSALDQNTPPTQKATELFPIKLQITRPVASLIPVFTQYMFLASQVLPLFLITMLFFFQRKKNNLREDAAYIKKLEATKALKQDIHKIHKAFSRKTPELFYDATQHAIKEVIAKNHPSKAEALTLNEITEHLTQKHAPEDLITSIEVTFHMGDILKFSGVSAEQKTLTPDKLKEIEKLINELEKWS